MSIVAGANFVAAGLPNARRDRLWQTSSAKIARFPKAFLLRIATLHGVEPESWDALKFTLDDPIPYLLEMFKVEE
jgi:hypothetical protein